MALFLMYIFEPMVGFIARFPHYIASNFCRAAERGRVVVVSAAQQTMSIHF